MEVITYTQARRNFSVTMKKVCVDHVPVVITSQNSAPVVMMSLADFNAIEETLYLMRSPKNYARLLKSVENVEKGQTKERKLIEEDRDDEE